MARIELTLVEKQHDEKTNKTVYIYPTIYVDPDVISYYLEIVEGDIASGGARENGARSVVAMGKREYHVAESTDEIMEKELQCNLGMQ